MRDGIEGPAVRTGGFLMISGVSSPFRSHGCEGSGVTRCLQENKGNMQVIFRFRGRAGAIFISEPIIRRYIPPREGGVQTHGKGTEASSKAAGEASSKAAGERQEEVSLPRTHPLFHSHLLTQSAGSRKLRVSTWSFANFFA